MKFSFGQLKQHFIKSVIWTSLVVACYSANIADVTAFFQGIGPWISFGLKEFTGRYRCSITTYHFQIFDHFLYACLASRKTHITYPSISRTFFKWSLASGLLRWFCWCNWVFFANPQGSKSWLQQKSFRRDSIAPVTFYLGVSLSLMPKCRNPCTALTMRNSSPQPKTRREAKQQKSKTEWHWTSVAGEENQCLLSSPEQNQLSTHRFSL